MRASEAVPPLDTLVEIETPEHIVFRHRIAGPTRRLLALLLDLLICYAVVIAVALVVLVVTAAGSISVGDEVGGFFKAGLGLTLILLFLAQWGYFFVFEGLTGRTPGKRVLALRVLTVHGRPIGFGAAALRNLVRAADSLPSAYVLGALVMSLSPRFQRLGDLVAGTIVVVDQEVKVARPVVLSPPAHPQEVEGLPEHVTLDADERAAIELFLRRQDTLGPARADELARMIAPQLAARYQAAAYSPARLLALLYDRASHAGRNEGPVSSRNRAHSGGGASWR